MGNPIAKELRTARQPLASQALRRGISAGGLLFALFLLIASAALGYYAWQRQQNKGSETNAILHTVSRENFNLSVTERGEIESGGVTEIRSEVKTKNTPGLAILRIVPEGTKVSKGDFVVELDSSALQEERTTQQILVNTSLALKVEAQNLYETAVIAKREYSEGTFVQERQTIESEVFVAEENLNRAKEYFEYSKRLAAKGYVNNLQLEADKFAVEKSKKELDAAKTKLNVLEEFTREKMVKQLDSDILIAKAKWESEKSSHALEVSKLEEIEDQIAKCTINAPRDGVVTYAHDRDRRGDEEFIVEEGAVVRERQAIINLPDPSSMRVELTINESLIQHVKAGMPAKIRPVGIGGRVLQGEVQSVNRYAEPSGWRQANVKDYRAYISIDNPGNDLRSGMTASVTIDCIDEPDVLQTKVQSVYMYGKEMFCFVRNQGKWIAKKVEVGPTNDMYFVIRNGLEAGDQVAMNPKRFLEQVDLPKLPPTPQGVKPQQQRQVPPGTVAEATVAEQGETSPSQQNAAGG